MRGRRAGPRLRARKHREDKPFAIMAADLDQARALCEVDGVAADLLTSRRRPIVLLPRRAGPAAGPGTGVARPVAPGNRCLGVMLPYTALHHLLLARTGPIVLTSGNVSDEPIAYADDDALAKLRGIADAFLTHDRPIHVRTDDSVVRTFRGRAALVRRARGHAPEPLRLRTAFARPVLACGAELKSTFCTPSTCPPSTRRTSPTPTPAGLSWSASSTTTRTSRPAWPTTAPTAPA